MYMTMAMKMCQGSSKPRQKSRALVVGSWQDGLELLNRSDGRMARWVPNLGFVCLFSAVAAKLGLSHRWRQTWNKGCGKGVANRLVFPRCGAVSLWAVTAMKQLEKVMEASCELEDHCLLLARRNGVQKVCTSPHNRSLTSMQAYGSRMFQMCFIQTWWERVQPINEILRDSHCPTRRDVERRQRIRDKGSLSIGMMCWKSLILIEALLDRAAMPPRSSTARIANHVANAPWFQKQWAGLRDNSFP